MRSLVFFLVWTLRPAHRRKCRGHISNTKHIYNLLKTSIKAIVFFLENLTEIFGDNLYHAYIYHASHIYIIYTASHIYIMLYVNFIPYI